MRTVVSWSCMCVCIGSRSIQWILVPWWMTDGSTDGYTSLLWMMHGLDECMHEWITISCTHGMGGWIDRANPSTRLICQKSTLSQIQACMNGVRVFCPPPPPTSFVPRLCFNAEMRINRLLSISQLLGMRNYEHGIYMVYMNDTQKGKGVLDLDRSMCCTPPE